MKSTLSQVDVLVIPTPNTGRVLLGNGLKPKAVENCGFGLEAGAFRPAGTPKSASCLRVGYVGTFRHSKGLHILLQAMRDLPADRVQLDVYGSAGHFPDYDAWLSKLAEGLANVHFRGTFPNERLAEVFSGFDVLVIPALWHENSPLVLLSAFALKTPIIASRIGSLADLVEHDKSGLLFEMGNVDDLTRQIGRLMNEPQLLERLRAGIPAVKTIDQNIDELLGIYARLAGECHERSQTRGVKKRRTRPRAAFWWGSLWRTVRMLGLGVRFGDDLALLKCRIEPHNGEYVSFDFEWHSSVFNPDWVVFIHFLDEDGRTQAQGDHSLGVRDPDPWGYITYQLKVWIPAEHLGKNFVVRLGVWTPNEGARLPITRARGFAIDAAESAVLAGRVRIG